DDGSSVDQQRKWAHDEADGERIVILAEFTDQAKKGHETAKRTDFHAMLRFCQEQTGQGTPVDAILCWDADRFSRADSQETAWYIWEFRKCGVGRMRTARKWLDFSRKEDHILFNIEQDTSCHEYVINLAANSTRGRIDAAREGRWNGGPPPY